MNPYLLSALESTPVLIEREVRAFSHQQYDHRPDPDRFSMREVVAHLADWEPILLGRIQQAVASPGSTIQAMDEGQRAIEQGYGSRDPLAELHVWRNERAKSIEYIRGLTLDDVVKEAVHTERGRTTAGEMCNLFPCHDIYHVLQLAKMRESLKTIDTW
jgi:hypothetical protein